jgi:hypothetical protein
MVAMTSRRRSDEQLEFVLYETANWMVYGGQGLVLCEVASLRLAIEKAAEFAARGREVVAVVRRPSAEIVVFSGQLRKLTNLLSESRNSEARCKLGHANRVSGPPLNDSLGALIGFEGPRSIYREARV